VYSPNICRKHVATAQVGDCISCYNMDMRSEERIARLEAENVQLREQISQLLRYKAENASLREQVSQLLLQLAWSRAKPGGCSCQQ
jgi:hypothetical protein